MKSQCGLSVQSRLHLTSAFGCWLCLGGSADFFCLQGMPHFTQPQSLFLLPLEGSEMFIHRLLPLLLLHQFFLGTNSAALNQILILISQCKIPLLRV